VAGAVECVAQTQHTSVLAGACEGKRRRRTKAQGERRERKFGNAASIASQP